MPTSQPAAIAQKPESVSELIKLFRSEYPADQAVTVRFADASLRVLTNSSEIAAGLADYFAPFLSRFEAPDILVTVHQAPPLDLEVPLREKPPEPGKDRVKEAFVDLPDGRLVRKTRTGMCFAFNQQESIVVGPCRENLNQVVNFVNNCSLRPAIQGGALLGHAAGVAFGGNGLALAGVSGTGKSTLALRLLGLGADFVSNDRLAIFRRSNGLGMRGLAKHPRVNPGTLLSNPDLRHLLSETDRAELAGLPENELWSLERKYDVPIHVVFGSGRFRLEAGLRALMVLTWSPECRKAVQVARVDPEESQDVLRSFIKAPGLFLETGRAPLETATVADYQKLLRQCPVYEISGGVDFDRVARTCREIARKRP